MIVGMMSDGVTPLRPSVLSSAGVVGCSVRRASRAARLAGQSLPQGYSAWLSYRQDPVRTECKAPALARTLRIDAHDRSIARGGDLGFAVSRCAWSGALDSFVSAPSVQAIQGGASK